MTESRSTLILRVPAALHQRLKQEARAADLSLNQHCRALLGRTAAGAPAAANPESLKLAGGGSDRASLLQDLSTRALHAWESDVEAIALFGSFARGRETARSDIDLLVVLNSNVALDRDAYSRWRIQKFEGREVAPLLVQIPADGERIGGLWFEVAVDGMVLFDRNLRLSRFLTHVRDLIAGGRVRRMVTHGHPYWVYADGAAQHSSSEVEDEKPRSRTGLSAQGRRKTQGS